MPTALGLRMCDRCQCYAAGYSFEYDDVRRGRHVRLELCRACQRQVVDWLDEAQGIRS